VSGVYGGSTLNLAASSARDRNYDPFFDRDSKNLKYLYRFQMQFGTFRNQDGMILCATLLAGTRSRTAHWLKEDGISRKIPSSKEIIRKSTGNVGRN
jgi:hypothetical protein